MPGKHKLSLTAAVVINLNIIMGSGIFINTTELAKRAGVLGAMTYVLVGLLLFPLILSFVKLLQIHKGGGFYSFGKKSLGPFAGFISTWAYFTTKLSSATVVTHTFVLLMQEVFPFLATISSFVLDICIVSLLIALNLLNVKTGSKIQMGFMGIKLIPILFVIVTGLFFLQGAHLTPAHQFWVGIPLTMPLVLFAMAGFEAACSVSSKIENAEVNAPRAVLFSYGIVMVLYLLYQGMFYGILGTSLAYAHDYRSAFPLLAHTIFPANEYWRNTIEHLLHLAIAISAIGSVFGKIYTNTWNLYTLVQEKHTFFSSILSRLNRYHIPEVCVLIEGLIIFLYLLVTGADQVTLQQISALGVTITYSISVLGLFATMLQNNQTPWLPFFGLINCSVFFCASAYSIWKTSNIMPLYVICSILFFGFMMFKITENKDFQKKST